ncbi:hypothetical protein U0070_025619, partial [Myodes glareolus]
VDKCVRCREDQYANREQNQCIPKAVIFLNYKEPLGIVLALTALFFSAFTTVVLGVFLKHHDTPIVKANNQNLSYILLISLIFSFLCPLLFIGHPNLATCVMQQVTFGVVFTVAVSTVLAKTVTVLLAFKVTVPGRRMRYFLVSGAPNYIIAIFTLIQIIFCAIWLRFSPPFIENDAQSEHGQIIIVCNKGSLERLHTDPILDSPIGTTTVGHYHAKTSHFKMIVQTVSNLKYSDEYLKRLKWMKFNCQDLTFKCKTTGMAHDVDKCVRCPEDQYANKEQKQCIPKVVVFLNYKDHMGVALSLMALFFSAFTAVVLAVFVKCHDTPIVKANNQNLSYILLISLIFSFLCPLLFIGHPNSATCIMQYVTFGVVFTVAVSTVLAKTVTVLLAFKVTSPGNRMWCFLVSGVPNYIIVICTLIQVILCAIWLRFSPPFIDNDMHSVHDQII